MSEKFVPVEKKYLIVTKKLLVPKPGNFSELLATDDYYFWFY